MRVPYKRFAENRNWAKALDLSVKQFCASPVLWYDKGQIYNNEHLKDALEAEAAERNRGVQQQEDSRAEAREQRNIGNFEAADRWTVEYEAQQRAARGPTIVEVEGPDEPLWAPEEFAAMQAAVSADRDRKRQAAEGLVFHNKRSRNHLAARLAQWGRVKEHGSGERAIPSVLPFVARGRELRGSTEPTAHVHAL